MTLADLVPRGLAASAATATARVDHQPEGALTASPATSTTVTTRAATTDDPRPARGADRAPEHEILQGIDLTVGPGEVHAIMGPNGSGKTTLAYALMGHPAYMITGGSVTWKGHDLLKMSRRQACPARDVPRLPVPDRDPRPVASRASSARRSTPSAPGSSRTPTSTRPTRSGAGSRWATSGGKMREKMALLKVDETFASRYVNEGFSGGEKKRLEMLQMAVLEPEMAILDETDSGLDIDALRIVAEGVNAMLNPAMGVLLITHYQRLLNYIKPDVVHVLALGRIVKTGGNDLALRLEDEGYGPILREEGLELDVPDEALLVAEGPAVGEVDDDDRREPRRASPPAGRRPSPTAASSRPSIREPCAPTSRSSARDQRPSAGLPRLGVDQPEARRRDRRPLRLLPRVQRQRPSRDLHDRRRGDGGLRAGPDQGRPLHQRPDRHEVIFTRNATEAINLVAYSWGRRNIAKSDTIVLTEMEHHANLVPWQLLVQEKDGDLEFIPITDDGDPPPRRLRGPPAAQAEARRLHPRQQHAGHDQPGPRDGRAWPTPPAPSS